LWPIPSIFVPTSLISPKYHTMPHSWRSSGPRTWKFSRSAAARAAEVLNNGHCKKKCGWQRQWRRLQKRLRLLKLKVILVVATKMMTMRMILQ